MKKEQGVRRDQLPNQIARATLVAPDKNPKTNLIYAHEVAFTVRPGWSKRNKYETALPGGKIEFEEGDFEGIVEAENLEDPGLIITLDQMIQAGLHAAEREVLQELGVTLTSGLLQFVDRSTNNTGWTTYSYVGELEEKPTLLVKPDSAGTRWIESQQLMTRLIPLLSGHLRIVRRALKKVGRG